MTDLFAVNSCPRCGSDRFRAEIPGEIASPMKFIWICEDCAFQEERIT